MVGGRVHIAHQQLGTLPDIQRKIKEALVAAELQDYILPAGCEYDDACGLVVLSVEANWCQAICRVVVFADCVARWHRFKPYSVTTGVITDMAAYDTVECMINLVRERVFVKRSPAWLQGSPDVMSEDYLSHD